MDPLPKIVRDRMQAAAKPEAHPDANLLAAFAENSLREAERSQVLEHLAGCADCRGVVAVSLPEFEMADVMPAVAMLAAPKAASFRFQPRMLLRWGALAACVIVGAVMIIHRQTGNNASSALVTSKQETATAELKAAQEQQSVTEKKSSDSEGDLFAKLEPGAKSEARREMQAAPSVRQRMLDKPITGRGEGLGTGIGPVAGVGSAGGIGAGAAGAVSTPTRGTNERDFYALSQVVAPPPPAPATVAQPAVESSKSANLGLFKAPAKSEVAADKALNIPVANETVTVEAGPAQVTTQSASVSESKLAKAKTKNDAGFRDKIQEETANIVTAQSNAKYLGDEKDVLRSGVRFPIARWTLSPKGELLRSLDLGESWHPVEVAPKVVFRALSVSGREVWAGGARGVLYHSADGGEHWLQIKPVADGHALSGDITGIEFTDVQHGKVTTENHETWITVDGGPNWQKK